LSRAEKETRDEEFIRRPGKRRRKAEARENRKGKDDRD
jgi:hypothetical protein